MADVTVPQGMALDPGFILVLDRGYQDYALFGKWTGQDVFFVTRLKSNAVFEVMANIGQGLRLKTSWPIKPSSSPAA
ncbi:hypothetical protein DFAR_2510008 [Desulfarculales bacterium]